MSRHFAVSTSLPARAARRGDRRARGGDRHRCRHGPRRRAGPENIADVAEKVIDAVVNISTSQKVEARMSASMPDLPPGSPFEEFFDDFFKNRHGQGQGGDNAGPARRTGSTRWAPASSSIRPASS